jgi:ribonuclease/clavin/mitogillin
MPTRRPSPLARLGARGLRLEQRELGPGLTELRMHSQPLARLGFPVCAYLVDELLIDAGFAHVAPLLREALEGRRVRAIALTHHHEDHSGGAALLAARLGCPVLLRRPDERWSEGLRSLPAYRRLYYGAPEPYEPEAMPAELYSGARTLRCVPSGGHSSTHTAFLEPEGGLVFTGDLYVSRGASAVMRHEDPFELLESLRRIEALGARRMLTGHGLDLEDPGYALRHKIERIEAAIALVLTLHEQGLGPHAIRQRVFPRGAIGDRGHALLTRGEFSRANFVRAVIACQRS